MTCLTCCSVREDAHEPGASQQESKRAKKTKNKQNKQTSKKKKTSKNNNNKGQKEDGTEKKGCWSCFTQFFSRKKPKTLKSDHQTAEPSENEAVIIPRIIVTPPSPRVDMATVAMALLVDMQSRSPKPRWRRPAVEPLWTYRSPETPEDEGPIGWRFDTPPSPVLTPPCQEVIKSNSIAVDHTRARMGDLPLPQRPHSATDNPQALRNKLNVSWSRHVGDISANPSFSLASASEYMVRTPSISTRPSSSRYSAYERKNEDGGQTGWPTRKPTGTN